MQQPPPQQQHNVVIVGGGLAGLSTAIALRRLAGSSLVDDVRVIDSSCSSSSSSSSSQNRHHVGAAVQLTPNGLRALGLLGGEELLNNVLENSSVIENNWMILPGNEKPYDNLQRLPPSPPSDLPTVMIRWTVLRQILASQLPTECLVQAKVTSFRDSKLTLEHHGVSTVWPHQEQQQLRRSSPSSNVIVVAADGHNSLFRPSPAVPKERINFKAVIHHTVDCSPFDTKSTYALFSSGMALFFGPAGPGWTYWAVSVNTKDANTSTSIESSPKKYLLQALQGVPQERQVFLDLIQATEESTIFKQVSVEAPLCFQNEQQQGVLLVGDAAHAMAGSYGQASSFAMEDAVTLACCLATSPNSSLANKYSALRLERCQEMQRKSQERAARAMRGEESSSADDDDVVQWIHDWTLKMDKEEDESDDSPMEVVG